MKFINLTVLLFYLFLFTEGYSQYINCGTTQHKKFHLVNNKANNINNSAVINVHVYIVRDKKGREGVAVHKVESALITVKNIFENYNICVNIVSIDDIKNDNFYDFYGGHTTLNSLYNYTHDNLSLNIYVVEKYSVNASLLNSMKLGLANGIPGNALYVMDNTSNVSNIFSFGHKGGRLIAHEMGHCLGLFHTHDNSDCDELVNGSNCNTCGDKVCDTPADPGLSGYVSSNCGYTGGLTDTNGDYYTPLTNNIMSYSLLDCITDFTPGQIDKIFQTIYDNNFPYSYVNNNLYVFHSNENYPYTLSSLPFNSNDIDVYGGIYSAYKTIYSNNITLQPTSNLTYVAGESIVIENLTVEEGAYFEAYIGYDCSELFIRPSSNQRLAQSTSQNPNRQIEIESVYSFTIYPNPTTGRVTIEQEIGSGTLTLYNQLMQPVFTTNINHSPETIDISHLPKGVYIARFVSTASQTQITKKLVVQ